MTAAPKAMRLLAGFSARTAVDATAFLGASPFRVGSSASVRDAQSYASRHGLSALWVSHLASLYGFGTRAGNAICLADSADVDLLVPFAVIDPSVSGWSDELDWARELGAAGVRIAPAHHGYRLSDATPVADACHRQGIPLQVLVRVEDPRARHPRWNITDPTIDEIAEFVSACAEARLVLSGLRWDEWRDLRSATGALPSTVQGDLWNVSGPFDVADLFADEPGRWLFGSAYPLQPPEASMLQLSASALGPAVLQRITRANARELIVTTG